LSRTKLLEVDLTMARKLSEITNCAVFLSVLAGGLLATAHSRAEEAAPATTAPVTAAPVVVQNPFVAPASKAKKETPLKKGSLTQITGTGYRNPFAYGSAAPPIDPAMLPGPISRWRPSSSPRDGTSPVKEAILSATAIEGLQSRWDELPAVETLRDRGVTRHPLTTPAAGDFGQPPDPARFAPTPLAQPAWLAAEAQPIKPASSNASALFDSSFDDERSQTSANGPVQAAHLKIESAFDSVADIGHSADDLRAQAQQAASAAQSVDDLSNVAGLCQQGLASNPSLEVATSLRRLAAWAHNRRGELLADEDRAQEALDAFQSAIALDATCSQAIHNRAVSHARRGEFAAALDDFNRVIELNPGLDVAYRNRAELLAVSGRFEEAVADYSRAIESLPSDADLLAARGDAWQRIGDFDRATADFDRAIEISPNDPTLITQRGNLAAQRGDYESALSHYEQAVTIDAQYSGVYRSLAWLRATCSDDRYHDADQALKAARIAAELAAPVDYLVLETLAAAHAAAGEFEEGVRIQRQAIAAAPPALLGPLRQRLSLYESRRPFLSVPVEKTAFRPSPRR
jgi:tetratricopeptide (TPR) repeat protein